MTSSKKYGYKVRLNYLKNGDITYYIRINNWEKKIGRKSDGITELKCMQIRSQIKSEQEHGVDLSQKSFKYLTFDKLAEVYFISNEAHNKSNKQYSQMYDNHIKPSFGDIVISKLDDSLIYELQALKKAEEKSSSTINIIVKLIRRIIGFGISKGIIQSNPFKNIKLFKINNTRLRYLNKNEVFNLYSVVAEDVILNIFVRIALATGARANSVLAIQKKDINLIEKTIMLKDFKRNNTYIGYLDEISFELVCAHIKNFSLNSYVVSKNGEATKYQKIYLELTAIFKHFNNELAKNDRINRVVIHTLRHTFASHLAIAGVSIQEIQRLMNHKDINQTLKYAKLNTDSGRKYTLNLYKEDE